MGAYGVNKPVDLDHEWPYHVNMEPMNDSIREAVRVELARRRSTQARLADEVGVSRQYISDIMSGKSGNVPSVWSRIFEQLGLELIVVPKANREGR